MGNKNRLRNTETESRFNKIFDFDLKLKRERIPKLIPFIVFISFLTLMYIANKYYAEKAMLEQSKLKKELKDLRAESLTIKAELMDKTKRSKVAEMTKEIGLMELKEPAKKVVVKEDEY